MKILIVEDELKVASFLQKGLQEYGFQTLAAWDVKTAWALARQEQPDLLVMDVNLPDGNGLDLCRDLRTEGFHMPIIMLTARSSTVDKLEGFDAGADDYLPKPFEFTELIARIRALLRRSAGSSGQATTLVIADLTLNLLNRTASRGGKTIDLTHKEFNLLELLVRNQGRVLDRSFIYDRVWDPNYDTESNTVDIYIHFLRKKIDQGAPQRLIHTVKGVGYMISGS